MESIVFVETPVNTVPIIQRMMAVESADVLFRDSMVMTGLRVKQIYLK